MNRRAERSAATVEVVAGQRKHRPDYQIVLFTGLLMLLGLIIMYAIGPQRANLLNLVHGDELYSGTYFVIKQAISLAIAAAAFFVFANLKYEWLKKHATKFLYLGFALCTLLFVAGNMLKINSIAVETLGAYRWFYLGSLGTFQPAEVLKFSLLLFLAGFLGMRYKQGKINDKDRTIYPAIGVSAAALFFVVVLQKDLGTGLSIASTIFAMLVVSGMSWKVLGKLAIISVVLVLLLTIFVPHRRERLMTFMNGDNHSTAESEDANYHIKNAMIALGSGGLVGLGIGNSVQATGYLPEAVNDSVFAIIGETFGFIGTVCVLLLFTALLMRVLRVSDHMPDMSMRLVVAGVFGWVGAHILMNVASMLGIVPLTGITLPLLSFGGTSMVFIAAALGLVFQLSRYTSHVSVSVKEESDESTRSGRGVGRSRHARRRSN